MESTDYTRPIRTKNQIPPKSNVNPTISNFVKIRSLLVFTKSCEQKNGPTSVHLILSVKNKPSSYYVSAHYMPKTLPTGNY